MEHRGNLDIFVGRWKVYRGTSLSFQNLIHFVWNLCTGPTVYFSAFDQKKLNFRDVVRPSDFCLFIEDSFHFGTYPRRKIQKSRENVEKLFFPCFVVWHQKKKSVDGYKKSKKCLMGFRRNLLLKNKVQTEN